VKSLEFSMDPEREDIDRSTGSVIGRINDVLEIETR
jgi:hypothetical protein